MLRVLGGEQRYVSRGGLKLEAALSRWHIDLTEKICADIGASTGGFTDCMLQHGAGRVYAVDTGYGQIAAGLRTDPRVTLLERTNARYLKPGDLPEGLGFVSMDVSFISATLVLPAVMAAALAPGTGSAATQAAAGAARDPGATPAALLEAVVLVKPQFEAGRKSIGKGGIVHDPEARQFAIERVRTALYQAGAVHTDLTDSPILGGGEGAKGNREFLLYARF